MAWAEFRRDVVTADRSQRNTRRYIRFNLYLERRALSVSARIEMRSLQSTVKKRLALPYCASAVQHVAHRLIASSLFLDVRRKTVHSDGSHRFECSVLCKFENGSHNLRALGRLLGKMSNKDFRPHILVKSDARSTEGIVHDISLAVIPRMALDAVFSMPEVVVATDDEAMPSNVTLMLCPHDSLEPEGFYISGMLKVLANESGQLGRPSPRKVPFAASSWSIGALSRSESISLNTRASRGQGWIPTAGPLAICRPFERADSAPEVHVVTQPFSLESVISYIDCKWRNRFWAYIAPAHMAKHRHFYPQGVLETFVSSVASEPVELDAGDDTEIKRLVFSELADTVKQPKRASVHYEVHADRRLSCRRGARGLRPKPARHHVCDRDGD